ncbi:MAG: hypothetical protein RMH97_01170 [Verrucomicrobiales bacterium]|nr:hypothetical protein [Verrucomicrobiales bacterium]
MKVPRIIAQIVVTAHTNAWSTVFGIMVLLGFCRFLQFRARLASSRARTRLAAE